MQNGELEQKIGEVLAFEEVGVENLQKGKEALKNKLGEEDFSGALSEYRDNLEKIRAIKNSQIDIINKAEATIEKLSQMRELYLGGKWDDPTEILEWLGFFEGAAVVHWSLINSMSKENNDTDLAEISKEILSFHSKFLVTITNAIRT